MLLLTLCHQVAALSRNQPQQFVWMKKLAFLLGTAAFRVHEAVHGRSSTELSNEACLLRLISSDNCRDS